MINLAFKDNFQNCGKIQANFETNQAKENVQVCCQVNLNLAYILLVYLRVKMVNFIKLVDSITTACATKALRFSFSFCKIVARVRILTDIGGSEGASFETFKT